MDLDEARTFIRDKHRAVLSTMRGDGTPQMTPVLVTVDEQDRVVVSTTRNTSKVHNLRRDPRAWLCVLPDRFFGEWIQVEGSVSIIELPEAMPLLERYYRSISGEHEDWAAYRAAMEAEGRVVVQIELTRAGPDRS